jgi:hypothetical protein
LPLISHYSPLLWDHKHSSHIPLQDLRSAIIRLSSCEIIIYYLPPARSAIIRLYFLRDKVTISQYSPLHCRPCATCALPRCDHSHKDTTAIIKCLLSRCNMVVLRSLFNR